MKLVNLLKLFVVLIIVSVFTSCDNNDYVNVIPANAPFVSSINVGKLVAKSEFSKSSAFQMFKSYIGLVATTSEDKTEITKLLEDPSQIGMDFSKPIYVFNTIDDCIGLTIKMNDEGDFENFLELLRQKGFCGKSVERDGIQYNILFDDLDFAYNSEAILFLVSENSEGKAVAKRNLSLFFEQDADKSFISTEHFQRLSEGSDDISMYANLGAMPDNMSSNIKKLLPKGITASDVEFIGSADFKNGKIELKASVYSEKDAVQKALEEGDKYLKHIEGKYIDSPSEDFMVWAGANINGEWLLNLLKQDKDMKQGLFLLGRGIDVDMMLKAIDGDVALILPQNFVTKSSEESQFICFANLKNSDFLKDVAYWKKSMSEYGMTMTETAKNHYNLKAEGYSFNWGVDDKDLFIATEEAYKQNAFSKRSEILKDYSDEIESSSVFVFVNLKSIPMSELGQVLGMRLGMSKKMSSFKSLIFRMSDCSHYEVIFEMDNDDENVLKQLLNFELNE